jgi:predicted metal-dependent hydrolase
MASSGSGGRAGAQAPVERYAVDYAGRRLEFDLRRSTRRRSVGLTIEPDGSLRVAAPLRMPLALIAAFVREKAAWVLKHQLRLASLAASRGVAERRFAEGEALPLLDEQLTLHYAAPHSGVPPQVWREGGRLCLRGIPAQHADEPARREAVRRALEGWYHAQAHEYFTGACARYARSLGLDPSRVSIGDAQRRWGSCSGRGSLRFTWRLLLAPQALADYVAAHEVAHRVELNHSLRFWRVVAKLMPDFKARERKLAEIGSTLVL